MFLKTLKQAIQEIKLNKKTLLIVAAVLILLGTGLFFGIRFYQDKKFADSLIIRQPEEMGNLPVEAFYDYDTREYPAMFNILEINPDSKTLKLGFIYPFKYQGNEIVSKVNCRLENTAVYLNQEDRLVSSTVPFYQDARIVPGRTIMQAICQDQFCRKITKYCEFIII
ncbi:MAG: hypothetical protein AB1721_01495 [Patescibacteria group bacterium]